MTSRVLFDVTGLVQWYSFLSHPSGVQRFTEKVLQSRPVAAWPTAVFVARAFGGDEAKLGRLAPAEDMEVRFQ